MQVSRYRLNRRFVFRCFSRFPLPARSFHISCFFLVCLVFSSPIPYSHRGFSRTPPANLSVSRRTETIDDRKLCRPNFRNVRNFRIRVSPRTQPARASMLRTFIWLFFVSRPFCFIRSDRVWLPCEIKVTIGRVICCKCRYIGKNICYRIAEKYYPVAYLIFCTGI